MDKNAIKTQNAQETYNEYDIKNNKILGECIAHVDIIEFQKRCLPHTHMMLWLNEEDLPRSPEDYDEFICAELPDPKLDVDIEGELVQK